MSQQRINTTGIASNVRFGVPTSINRLHWLDGTVAPWTCVWGYVCTVDTTGFGHNALHLVADHNYSEGRSSISSSRAYGSWKMRFRGEATTLRKYYFVIMCSSYAVGQSLKGGYSVQLMSTGEFYFIKHDSSGNETILASTTWTADNNPHEIHVIRDNYGKFTVYLDDTFKLECTDNTITTSTLMCVGIWSGYMQPHMYIDWVETTDNPVTYVLTSIGLSSNCVFGVPKLKISIVPVGISSSLMFGMPVALFVLSPSSISSSVVFGDVKIIYFGFTFIDCTKNYQ